MCQSGKYVFMLAHYIFQFTLLDFRIILGGFLCLPDGKFTTRSQPGKFLKIWHFPQWDKQSPSVYLYKVFTKKPDQQGKQLIMQTLFPLFKRTLKNNTTYSFQNHSEHRKIFAEKEIFVYCYNENLKDIIESNKT